MKRIASLQEIETHWSLTDVIEANEGLDALEEAEAEASRPNK